MATKSPTVSVTATPRIRRVFGTKTIVSGANVVHIFQPCRKMLDLCESLGIFPYNRWCQTTVREFRDAHPEKLGTFNYFPLQEGVLYLWFTRTKTGIRERSKVIDFLKEPLLISPRERIYILAA